MRPEVHRATLGDMSLRLGPREFARDTPLVMAIVNRTPDSFYDKGSTFDDDKAHARVAEVIAAGADILDIGGVKAGPGETVDPQQEAERTVDFIAQVRSRHPDIPISVDTWRAEVGDAACQAGATVINDAWGGWDPDLATIAAKHYVGLVCTHAGGVEPRTRPHRIEYDDVVADVVEVTTRLAERALEVGVARESIMIDPGHDFGKNTYHSLEVTRRLNELVETGWPVLVSLSNKDFIGETLDQGVGERLIGTLAATSISAWLGAQVFRVHNVAETVQTLNTVSSIMGTRPPRVARRGLA